MIQRFSWKPRYSGRFKIQITSAQNSEMKLQQAIERQHEKHQTISVTNNFREKNESSCNSTHITDFSCSTKCRFSDFHSERYSRGSSRIYNIAIDSEYFNLCNPQILTYQSKIRNNKRPLQRQGYMPKKYWLMSSRVQQGVNHSMSLRKNLIK